MLSLLYRSQRMRCKCHKNCTHKEAGGGDRSNAFLCIHCNIACIWEQCGCCCCCCCFTVWIEVVVGFSEVVWYGKWYRNTQRGAFAPCKVCMRRRILCILPPIGWFETGVTLAESSHSTHQSTSAATVLGLSCTLPRVQMYRLYIWKHKYISQICRRGIYYMCIHACLYTYLVRGVYMYLADIWNTMEFLLFLLASPSPLQFILHTMYDMDWLSIFGVCVCVSRNKGLHVAFKRSDCLSVCCPFIYGFICGYWIRSSCLSLSAWLISSWQWGVEGPTYPAT